MCVCLSSVVKFILKWRFMISSHVMLLSRTQLTFRVSLCRLRLTHQVYVLISNIFMYRVYNGLVFKNAYQQFKFQV